MKARLIINKNCSAAFNMAADEYLLDFEKLPTVRLYTWEKPSISIGRFESIKDVVDLESCQKNNISIVRRITGGGSVFHDQEITYSITIFENLFPQLKDLHQSYQFINQAIINALKNIGLKADFVPLNDLVVNGKKISGCAQTRRKNKILQHGTVLISVDFKKMFSYLKVSQVKISDKKIKDVSQRVTSISQELKNIIDPEILINSLIFGFTENFKFEFVEKNFSKTETKCIKKIIDKRFSNKLWTYER